MRPPSRRGGSALGPLGGEGAVERVARKAGDGIEYRAAAAGAGGRGGKTSGDGGDRAPPRGGLILKLSATLCTVMNEIFEA